MGIVERMAAMAAEREAKELAEREAAREKEATLAASRANAARVNAEHISSVRAQAIENLLPYLELVDARRQLEEIRDQVWHIGEIDSNPKLEYGGANADFKKLSLALRAAYPSAQFAGESEAQAVFRRSDAVSIVISVIHYETTNNPFVSSRPGNQFIDCEIASDYAICVEASRSSEIKDFGGEDYLRICCVSENQRPLSLTKTEGILAEACLSLGDVKSFQQAQGGP